MSVSVALELALALLSRSIEISSLVAQAQAQGRTVLSADEWKSILDADDAARARLVAAIAAAQQK